MAHYESPYWLDGVCVKHWLPQTPCPQCIATKDVDMEEVETYTEKEMRRDFDAFSGLQLGEK